MRPADLRLTIIMDKSTWKGTNIEAWQVFDPGGPKPPPVLRN
jgi:hypothetical protein